MGISLISVPYIDGVFPKVSGWIARALGKHSAITLPRIYQMCRASEAFLLVDHAAEPTNAMVVQFDNRGGDRVLLVLAMGGKGGENWNTMFDEVCTWGKSLGAVRAVFDGRKGWQRVLPKAKVISQTYAVEFEG